ncbi:MAG TPA: hypothetical protein VHT34_05790 [Clostridia bacterium]|nr:hypothetical protein [Clostridia bacterium]
MQNKTMLYILIGLLCVFITIFAATLIIYVQLRNSKYKLKVSTKRKKDFLMESYDFLSKFVIARRYMDRIRSRVEMLELSDNRTISRKTMRFTFIALGISLILFILILLISRDIYYIIVGLLTIYIINKQILVSLVDKLDNKMLKQFEKFTSDMRHNYHEHNMVDEAIYDSTETCPYEMSLHAHKMYDILTSKNVEDEIDKYNDQIPNKYFKTFLSLCYTVQRFGDKIIDNTSMFINNLNYLKQEINLELLKREKIRYIFSSLAITAIAPVFALKLLEKWSVSNLPELSSFYEGPWGFVAQIAMFIIVFITYEVITRMQRINETEESNAADSVCQAILNAAFVRKFFDLYISARYSKAQKMHEMLKTSGLNGKVEIFYMKRVLFTVSAFIISLLVVINANIIARANIINSASQTVQMQSEVNKMSQKEIKEMDKRYIISFKGKKVTFEEVRARIVMEDNMDERLAGIAAERIYKKIINYNSIYFKWWELLICLVISIIAFQLPYMLIILRKKVMQMNMEDEVKQFHTIILMLMHIERMSVEDILNWMETYAVVFKASIQKCINNFESGDIEALEQLQIDEPFMPFARIVENLKTACGKIPIEQAFDELKMERGYYQEKRKQDNEMMINKKGAWARLIAYIPIGAVVFLYLILPFVMYSIEMMNQYSGNISGAL